MAGMFTCRCRAVMTCRTVRRDSGMVKVCRCPSRRRMAEITGVVTWDMRGVLACGCDAVMAAIAGTNYRGMIHSEHRHPGGIAVTILTHIRGLNM